MFYKTLQKQYNGIINGRKNENFQIKKNDILVNRSLISAHNIASGMEAVLMNIHNLCFKI